MPLATRITLLVTALLAVCGVAAGAAFHRAARRSLEAEIQGRLDTRLAWLAGALDVELEDGELQLDARAEPEGADAAQHWQVAATDGRVLWASPAPEPAEAVTRSRTVSFGKPGAAPVPPSGITAGDDTRDGASGAPSRAAWTAVSANDLPPPATAAVARAVPGLEIREAYRKTRLKKRPAAGDTAFEVRGAAGGRAYALRLDAAGNVLRVKDSAVDPFAEYELPAEAARVDLVLTARASAAEARDELSRLSRTLWSVGPLALALTAAGLALLIRWQLRPLAQMAEQAAAVGPSATAARIEPVGGGAELVRLRDAMNGMIARLAEGLERERRFAADAAHELRSPLGEMRATVEVALRRPREAAEYREALETVAGDLLRLQNLVVGLLHLTRADAAGVRGEPVSLPAVLRRAVAQYPARIDGIESPGDGAGDGDGATGPCVFGDAELLHAAIGNVLANAARYAPGEPPTVRVEPHGPGDVVRVVVSDRGPGVGEADRDRIFEPLTRLDAARTAAGPDGFGLGLSVARATARAFGGDLVCRGRADGADGAEFVFTFRRATLAPEDGVGVAAERRASPPANDGRTTTRT